MARDLVSLSRGVSRERFAGVIDFSYQHYALGDILTSQVNIACGAIEQGCAGVDLYFLINPSAPSASVQGFITPENYRTYLDNVFPALLCFLMAFGGIYKSISLRILLDLLNRPNRCDRYETILNRYVERESYQGRLRILIGDGLATRVPAGFQLTRKGRRIAAAAHALQRLFKIGTSG